MNHSNIARGQQVRRALLAVARECQAQGVLLPTYATLGAALGLSNPQISRHINRLLDDGVMQVSQVGRRFRIKGVQP